MLPCEAELLLPHRPPEQRLAKLLCLFHPEGKPIWIRHSDSSDGEVLLQTNSSHQEERQTHPVTDVKLTEVTLSQAPYFSSLQRESKQSLAASETCQTRY